MEEEFKEIKQAKVKFYEKYIEQFKKVGLKFNAFITIRHGSYVIYALTEQTTEDARLFANNLLPRTFEYDNIIYDVIIDFGKFNWIKDDKK
jgi:hypothetical protein